MLPFFAFLLSKYADFRFETTIWFSDDRLSMELSPFFSNFNATFFRGVSNQKSKEEIIKFDLRLVLSFRTMGVFFL